ncbi:hypothetical protein VNO78_12395 [Psophocarpus tetragonolobus]|uniref:Uncharacterized protein n=1 Tax=Psophocarpus tetragonolobus TaxID=3891 RepID=A0AAN9SNA0_PSOTE
MVARVFGDRDRIFPENVRKTVVGKSELEWKIKVCRQRLRMLSLNPKLTMCLRVQTSPQQEKRLQQEDDSISPLISLRFDLESGPTLHNVMVAWRIY